MALRYLNEVTKDYDNARKDAGYIIPKDAPNYYDPI